MTYPPPPPGAPGAGGWPAGDPHESPTMYDPFAGGQPAGATPPGAVSGQPAPGQPGYGQPAPGQPGYGQSPGYGPPPPASPPPGSPPVDPYQQSPYQPAPYQQSPYQADPYQPGGYPPGNYQPYPPGGFPPGMGGMPPQPPRRSRTGLIIAGVAGGVVLVMMLVVGGVLVARAMSEEEVDRPITEPPPTAPPTEPEPGGTEPPPPPPAGGGIYAFVPDMCNSLDLNPVFDIVPTPDSPEDWTGFESDTDFGSHSSCLIDLDDGSALGGLSIQVITTDGSAREDYQAFIESSLSVPDSVEEVDSPWEDGELWLGDDLADEAARIIALDGNLTLSVSAWLFSAPDTQDDLQAAVLEIAEEILSISAQ